MTTNATQIISDAPLIETERLHLKLLTPDTWSAFMDHATDEEICSILACHTPELVTLERARRKGGMTTLFISFRSFLLVEKQTGKTIGKAGFHTWQARHSRAEIGYDIAFDEYKRKGLMKEAVKAVIRHGFSEMNLYRIEAFAGPSNTASIRLLEGLGFKWEGLLRSHYNKAGEQQDSACYGLLKPEFELVKTVW